MYGQLPVADVALVALFDNWENSLLMTRWRNYQVWHEITIQKSNLVSLLNWCC